MQIKKATASDDMAAKAAGIDQHPGAFVPDPPHVQWAQDRSPNTPDRYGVELGATLEKAQERLIDPEGVSRASPPAKCGAKQPKRYRAGSKYLDVDSAIGTSAIEALWGGPGSVERSARVGLVKGTFEAIKPRNEVEGLLGAQLIACAGAAMECFRRAAIPQQSEPARNECFNQANKASRTFAVLLEALDRHRGKGSQQRVEVRHVHVHAGGQAVVGVVGRGRGGKDQKSRKPHALAHSPQPTLPCHDAEREPVPGASDGQRKVPDARRNEPRRASR